MKVYISQPMRGRSKEEILDERDKGMQVIRVYYPDAEFLNNYFEDYNTSNGMSPMMYFAECAKLMAQADLIVFLPMYLGAGGCEVEDHIAEVYHIPRMYINFAIDSYGNYEDFPVYQ